MTAMLFEIPPAEELAGENENSPVAPAAMARDSSTDLSWPPQGLTGDAAGSPSAAAPPAADDEVGQVSQVGGGGVHSVDSIFAGETEAEKANRLAFQKWLADSEQWQIERQDAEHAHSQAELKLRAAKAHVKTCREIVDECAELLLNIVAREPKLPERKDEPIGELIEADFVVLPPPSWRDAPLSAVDFSGIKGLGPKKLDALYAACPTVGDLEDLRAKGSGKGIGLRSIKGIGEDAAQAIEDKVLEWLSVNRDGQVLSEARNGQPPAEQADVPCPLSTVMPSGIAANDPDALRAAQIEARAAELLAAEVESPDAIGTPELQPTLGDDGCWNNGVEAFDHNVPARDCPHGPGEPRDDWLRGWLTAKLDSEARGEEAD